MDMLHIHLHRTDMGARLCPRCRWDTLNIHICNLLVDLVHHRGCIQVRNMAEVVDPVVHPVLLKGVCRTCPHEMHTIHHSHHRTHMDIPVIQVDIPVIQADIQVDIQVDPVESNNVVTLMVP